MNKKIISSIFFLSPFLAFAHGEEVLVWLGIELIIWIIFIIYISFIKMKIKYRLFILILFLITQAILFYTTYDIAYLSNQLSINALSIFFPIATVLLAHSLISKYTKRKSIDELKNNL